MSKKSNKYQNLPEQKQRTPGKQHAMKPEPEVIRSDYQGSDKLKNKAALVTGGDSGIGRSVAVHFAREGADVAIVYLPDDQLDAERTRSMVEKEGRRCLLIPGDIRDKSFCARAVEETVKTFGKINVLVNNAGEQHPAKDVVDLDTERMVNTFQTNIFAMFYLVKAAVPHMKEGDSIVNTTSVTAFKGKPTLLDYSSTKGAITSFTRSLGKDLVKKGIRVNAVAPGPIWTPLIVSTFEKVEQFGKNTPMGRAGQPSEVAPAYVFLASADASYITSQIIHPNGGEVVA
jgi:NAD(P)-dependent dehydrogenase (short-subunit alcohol dehydrogenase family)